MKRTEDVSLSLRSVKARPLESLLLIVGIALGIGATSAGIAVISQSVKERNELLDSTMYREIVAQVREEAEDMELPATAVTQDSIDLVLSWRDLLAIDEVPDVEFAYLADETVFRFANFGFSRLDGASSSDVANVSGGREGAGEGEGTGEGEIATGVSEVPTRSIPEVDGPQPALDEAPGMRVSPEYFAAWNLSPAIGGIFTDQEMINDSKVMVVGSSLANTLFDDGIVLGRGLNVFESVYEIIGVLGPTGTSVDDMAIVPAQAIDVSTIRGPAGAVGGGSSLHFNVSDVARLDEAAEQLTVWFAREYGENQIAISIPREEVEASQDRSFRMIAIILFLSIAGLIIASINVSNILLGRAMRRRRVVGVLKALGATKRNVFLLFLLEALIISAAGAVLGVGVSMIMSLLLSAAVASTQIVSGMLFVGIAGACLVSVALTVFPAFQVSRISAAVALRYE